MQAEYTVSKFLYCQGISVVSKAFFLSDVAEFWIRIVTKGRMGPESEKKPPDPQHWWLCLVCKH